MLPFIRSGFLLASAALGLLLGLLAGRVLAGGAIALILASLAAPRIRPDRLPAAAGGVLLAVLITLAILFAVRMAPA